MDIPIKDIVEAFKQDFNPQECEGIYNLTHQEIIFTITKLKQFILHAQLQEVTFTELEALFNFIQNDDILETYINELIAPFAPGVMVGQTLESEFVGSIGIYDRFAHEKERQGGTIMIAPILVVCTLIQNAYLFINDMMLHHDLGYGIDKCKELSERDIEIEDIYRHVVHLIIKPLLEVLHYRVLNPSQNIPQYIVTSFGLIEAEYAIEHGHEITEQIEKTLDDMLKSLTPEDIRKDNLIN